MNYSSLRVGNLLKCILTLKTYVPTAFSVLAVLLLRIVQIIYCYIYTNYLDINLHDCYLSHYCVINLLEFKRCLVCLHRICSVSARHCFSLEDFVRHAALPSLLKACGGGGVSGNPANAPSPDTGARLTCHLLLRLFKTVDTPQPGRRHVNYKLHNTKK